MDLWNTIKKGAGDIWDSGVNATQQVFPWVGAPTEGRVFGQKIPTLNDITGVTAQRDAAAKDAANQAKYNSELERIFSRENRYSPEQLQTQQQLSPILMGQLYASLGLPMPGGTSAAGQGLYDAMTKSNQIKRGAEQGALDIGYKNASDALMNQNRMLMGSGSSGHIGGQLQDLAQQQMMARPQIEANYNQRQAVNQQGALSNLMSMAYGQPMGNQPYQPMQPSPASVNTFFPDLIGGAAGGAASALPFLLM